MKRDRNIDFTDVGHDRRPVGVRVALIVLLVMLLGGVSFVAIMARNDFDFSRFLGKRQKEEAGETETESQGETASVNAAEPFSDEHALQILFLCMDEDRMCFGDLVSFSEQENAVYVRPVSPERKAQWNGRESTVEEIAAGFGERAAASVFSDVGVNVDRVVGMTPAVFRQIVQTLGDAPVRVPRAVSFAVNGITYTLEAGEQTLKPDVLFYYMTGAFEGEDRAKTQADAFASLLRAHLTEENVQRGEEFFSALISRTTGDLTVFDFASHKDDALRFVRQSPRIEVIS